MLRDYFPTTNKGAELYGGFLHHENCFCRIFDLKGSLNESLLDINNFLEENGYPPSLLEEFNETYNYEYGPVSISPHGYQEQFVVFIKRDVVAKSQMDFLTNELIKFRDERDWNQFHNAKDLSIAISIEANELLELFLWKSPEEVNEEKIKEELADVFTYSLLLSEKLNFNVEEIILEKINRNAKKYPIDKSKGNAKKYNEL
jgi:NTP pyrophosphatase (non-canonical NTP hydrolase)